MTIDIETFAAQAPSPLPRAAKLQWIDLSLPTVYAACRGRVPDHDAATFGTAMNLPVEKVLEMKEGMSARHDPGSRFR